jgi:hypothetical protein
MQLAPITVHPADKQSFHWSSRSFSLSIIHRLFLYVLKLMQKWRFDEKGLATAYNADAGRPDLGC